MPERDLRKHTSEKLLLLLVVLLCLEDLKSISITKRSCSELYNNHLHIWQSKVRILILQFISFDILSVISPFPHNLFILRGRCCITDSLGCCERQLFPFPSPLSLSVSFFLTLVFFPPWFLPSLHASFTAFSKEKEEPCLLQLGTKYCGRERAHDDSFGRMAHHQPKVPPRSFRYGQAAF